MTSTPQVRYLLQLHLLDETGSTWASAFDTEGEKLIGAAARDLLTLQQQDPVRVSHIFQQALEREWIVGLKLQSSKDALQMQMAGGQLEGGPRIQVCTLAQIDHSRDAHAFSSYHAHPQAQVTSEQQAAMQAAIELAAKTKAL